MKIELDPTKIPSLEQLAETAKTNMLERGKRIRASFAHMQEREDQLLWANRVEIQQKFDKICKELSEISGLSSYMLVYNGRLPQIFWDDYSFPKIYKDALEAKGYRVSRRMNHPENEHPEVKWSVKIYFPKS